MTSRSTGPHRSQPEPEPRPTPEPTVAHDTADERFSVAMGGAEAELTYHRRGQRLVILHTGVPDELEGRGIGGALVQAAIDLARDEGLVVVPRCPFARAWLERHPDVAARLDIDWE